MAPYGMSHSVLYCHVCRLSSLNFYYGTSGALIVISVNVSCRVGICYMTTANLHIDFGGASIEIKSNVG